MLHCADYLRWLPRYYDHAQADYEPLASAMATLILRLVSVAIGEA
jgi:hypothetical protein